jgi:predicted TIM-barrel fold metal-dependent hydrolase
MYYFSLVLVIHYDQSRISHKVLFESDYPMVTPVDWLADF